MLKKVTIGLLIAVIPLFLLFNSYKFTAFNFGHYEAHYEKNRIYEKFNKTAVDTETRKLLNYLGHDKTDNPPEITLFNNEENIHLLEVKGLMQAAITAANVLTAFLFILLLALFFINRDGIARNLGTVFIGSGIFALAAAAIFFIFDFSFLFIKFHELLFTGQWQFPEASVMIQLFPEYFFSGMAKKIITETALETAFLTVMGAVFIWSNKKKYKQQKLS